MNPQNNVTYNKAVTIRGAGVYDHPDKKTKATYIGLTSGHPYYSTITFNLPSKLETDAKLYIEGVCLGYMNGSNTFINIQSEDFAEATISKCYSSRFECQGSYLHVYSCKGNVSIHEGDGYGDVQNSILYNYQTSSNLGRAMLQHCVIGSMGIYTSKSSFQDCIIIDYPGSDNAVPQLGTTFLNCLFCEEVNLEQTYHQSCYTGVGNIFNKWNTGDAIYINLGYDYTDCTLKEEAKSQYPASDGTEIGIYGGNYPYSMEVSLPYVTNIVPGNRTSNGKLPVTIEVK